MTGRKGCPKPDDTKGEIKSSESKPTSRKLNDKKCSSSLYPSPSKRNKSPNASIQVPRKRNKLSSSTPKQKSKIEPQENKGADDSSQSKLEVENDKAINIPERFVILENLFSALDDMIMFLEARGESLVFHKVKNSLEDICKRTVSITDIGKIRTIYPDAYIYRAAYAYTRGFRVKSVCLTIPDDDYASESCLSPGEQNHFTYSPSTPTRKNSALNPMSTYSPARSGFCPSDYFCNETPHNYPPQTPKSKRYVVDSAFSPILESPTAFKNSIHIGNRLKRRKCILRSRICKFIEEKCKENDSVDIEPDKMEEINENKEIYSPMKISPFLKSTPPPTIKTSPEISNPPTPEKLLTPRSQKIREILERVRKKEQENQRNSPSKKGILQREMISRLPHIAQALKFMVSSSNKNVFPIQKIIEKLSKCFPVGISETDSREHVILLAKLVPDWCQIFEVESSTFLKIDTDRKFVEINTIISKKVKEHLTQSVS